MPEFRHATLSNGLRIAAEIDRRGYSAAIGYFVRAGACDETDPEAGLSHFLEHMMFKGTARRSAADVNRELDELGGQSNAYTSEEQTVFYASVLPKFQHRIVDLLSDMLSPALDEQEFETERHVILEEIAKYEDQPPFGAFERAMECQFGPRGLGRRILGTSESIGSMTAGAMRDYFYRRYRPENIVLAACGNVDFDALVAQVEPAAAGWASRPLPPAPPADDPEIRPEGILQGNHLEISDAAQAYLVRIGDGPAMDDPERYAVRLLCSVLGDEGGSRMFWELIDSGRAEVATIWPQEFIHTGVLLSYLICAPDQMASNRRLIDQLVERLVERGVEPAELNQAINKATAGCIMQSERPGNRLHGLGSRWLTCNEYVSTDELLEAYRRVEPGAVAKAAARYLSAEPVDVLAAASGPASYVS